MTSSAARVAAASKFFLLMNETVSQFEAVIERWRKVEAGLDVASQTED